MLTRRLEFFSDINLVADAMGDADAAPVLLLHGGGQTRHAWRTILPAISALGLQAITVDLRGHGESGWPADGSYDSGRFINDLDQIIADLGQAPFLVGASLGGLIALQYAGAGLRAIRGLAMIDCVPRLNTGGVKRINGFMKAHPEGFASVEEAADIVARYRTNHERPPSTAGLMKNLRLGADGRYRWHWDPRFLNQRTPPTIEDYEAAARQVAVPTLLMRGGLSDVVTPDGVAAFRALVPQAEFVEVPGADHMLTGDLNSPYNQAVVAFIDRHI